MACPRGYVFSLVALALIACSRGGPQGGDGAVGRTTTDFIEPARLKRASALVPWRVEKNISTLRVEPYWIGQSERFWYLDRHGDAKTFWLVDATSGERRPAFDRVRLEGALEEALGAELETLPFDRLSFSPDESAIEFSYDAGIWSCARDGSWCRRRGADPAGIGTVPSPDLSRAVFLRGSDLWLRDLDDLAETPLTRDGADRHAYGRTFGNNADVVMIERLSIPETPIVLWSPDSRFVLTHRIDERQVRTMPLIAYLSGQEDLHPKVYGYPLAMPGDETLATGTLVVIDTETGAVLPISESTQSEALSARIPLGQAWWADARTACFIVHDRAFKKVELYSFDVRTGELDRVLAEESTTFLSLSQVTSHSFNTLGIVARVLPGSRELLWYSERDGWGHLYLYDLDTGTLKRQVTKGDWLVHEIVHLDEIRRVAYFQAGGREPGRNPYHAHLYRIALDGGEPELLTPEDADHDIRPGTGQGDGSLATRSFSPSGRYFVDTYARVDQPPVSVIRTSQGELVAKFHETDVSYLREYVRQWPEQFTVKARDGRTDLYGVLFKPSDFDATRRYPVIDYIYPGPFNIWTPRSLIDLHVYCESLALAELGFVVFTVDGLGSAGRSKAFHDVVHANLQDAGLPDHVAALNQLSDRFPWIDRERVGIHGISSGGYASALAMLTYPDVYDVGVSAAGMYDMRIGFAGWTERFQGPAGESHPPENYAPFILERMADRLEGDLMIAFGNLDENVHPAVTHRFIEALTVARKPYDLVLMVDRNHGFARSPYYVQRYWQHFVENLLGKEMPESFRLD